MSTSPSDLAESGIAYTVEPKGFPLKKPSDELKAFKAQDGPDGLLDSLLGLTVIDIHCTHQRFTPSDGDWGQYDSVHMSRRKKVDKYKKFSAEYPGFRAEIFSVSTGGVMSKDTITEVKEKWQPMVAWRDGGRGLLKKLALEIAFSVGKAAGNLLAMAKVEKLLTSQ